jgi:hypothetical protein
MDLDAYRASAEAFLSELTAEYRRHYAGLSATYEIEPIYERHAELFGAPAVRALRDAVDSAQGEERRRARMLVRFAAEGHVDEAVKQIEAELARREAALTLTVGGAQIGFRESAIAQANEPGRERRELIERARLEATERELNPLHREALALRASTSRALGYGSYRELCEDVQEGDLRRLAEQTASFLASTEELYAERLEPELRASVGVGLDELRRSDLPRFFRAAELDRWFPAGALIGSLAGTLARGAIDLPAQDGVLLDVESRRGKSPRAFCAPVRVPGEVHLVIAPSGGRDDYEALLHEAGHTEHYAHTAPELEFEFRMLGDNAITECFAFLLQHLVDEPQWLVRRLGLPDAEARRVAAHGRAKRLVYLRRYAAKIAYELELHSGARSDGELPDLYAGLLGDAVHAAWPPETYLADVDEHYYCACYLRAWALEAQLREWLRDGHGDAWFEDRAAWDALRELWAEGQRWTPEELLGELALPGVLDFRALAR